MKSRNSTQDNKNTTSQLFKQLSGGWGVTNLSVLAHLKNLYSTMASFVPTHPQMVPFFLALFPTVVEAAPNSAFVPLRSSLNFYSTSYETLYKLVYENILSTAARQLIEGACGVHANGTFPIVNFEEIEKWEYRKGPYASLSRAIGQPVLAALEDCIKSIVDTQYQIIQNERRESAGIVLLSLVIIIASLIAIAWLAVVCNQFKNHDFGWMRNDVEQQNESTPLIDEDAKEKPSAYSRT